MNARITPYTTLSTDEEHNRFVREALAAHVLAQAQKANGPHAADDTAIENVLARISPKALESITLEASSYDGLSKAIREAVAVGDLLPRREYLPEELEL